MLLLLPTAGAGAGAAAIARASAQRHAQAEALMRAVTVSYPDGTEGAAADALLGSATQAAVFELERSLLARVQLIRVTDPILSETRV